MGKKCLNTDMKKTSIYILLIFSAIISAFTFNSHNDDIVEIPIFVNQQANYIHYKEQLKPFFEKLQQLHNGKISKLHILHIGDSHLQAGALPAELRRLLQNRFGDAGRGLIFPYQIARTNAPFDIRSSSDIQWECSRNINPNMEFPIGICGYSLRTAKTSFNVDIQLKNEKDYFNKITIFSSDDHNFEIELWGDENEGKLITEKVDFHAGSCYHLAKARTGLSVSGKKAIQQPGYFTLQGILLENTENKGLLYSAVGVNGATFYAYNRSEEFMQQLNALEPDLIIISLGTNESADVNLSIPFVQEQVEKLLNDISSQNKQTSILITTPPDIYIRSRYKTKHGIMLQEMIHDIAKIRGDIAVWDFYEIMGGYGSINRWMQSKLAANDRIHYTVEGYQLQAQLIYNAIITTFEAYNSDNK